MSPLVSYALQGLAIAAFVAFGCWFALNVVTGPDITPAEHKRKFMPPKKKQPDMEAHQLSPEQRAAWAEINAKKEQR